MKPRYHTTRRLATLSLFVALGVGVCLIVGTRWLAEPAPTLVSETGVVELTASDVRNAANYGAGGVAPGEVVAVFPAGAGPIDIVPWFLEGNLKESTSIGETRVLFDGIAVPIVYTVRGRVGAIVPDFVEGQESTTLVVEYQGDRSSPVSLKVVRSKPAIFTLNGMGKGQAAMLNDTGCCNSVRNPAPLGSVVTLYATGEGVLGPEEIDREVSVTVGGVPAAVLFAKTYKAFQVNFRVPFDAPVGDAIPLVLTVRGRRSSPGVTVALRPATQLIFLVQPDNEPADGFGQDLERNGYRVIAGSDYQQTENQAGLRPDLLILDENVPEEQASETLAKLRQENPQLRTLVILGNLSAEALKRADLLGAQAVLTKPLESDKALASVERVLRRPLAVY